MTMLWGNTQVLYDSTGHQFLSLSLDRWTTSAFRSKKGLWDVHDEVDLEFLGNSTEDFHTYTIIWNPQMILILVDGTPIRQMKNQLRNGIPFPLYQPMRLYASIWNADDWAMQGGRIKTDWSQASFKAFFRNYRANTCVPYKTAWICSQGSSDSSWFTQDLGEEGKQKLKDVDNKYKIYEYCTDSRSTEEKRLNQYK
ncbi:hypothetical protein ABZP36_026082 [Zizania latifolia]